jgi:hypothetical protein
MNIIHVALVGIAAAAACAAPGDSGLTWALRVIGATLVTTVVPGALTVMAWRPRSELTVLELLGISIGVSVAIVQVLTIIAIMYAWSVDASLGLLAAWTIGHASFALSRDVPSVVIRWPWGEIALAAVLVLLAAALYAVGSPFDTTEPRVHISLVRRLVHLSSPTPYTLYLAPDVVYTYPFPGTHYLLALTSRAGNIDPFFLYYKARAFWGVAALTLVYGCAQVMFGNRRLSLTTTFVAAALVANGAFGAVPDFSWAQLAPLSHASDIAMGVLLPALLLLTLRAVKATESREWRFFGVAALGVAVMLIMVHPREIVQFLVYLTAFAAVAIWVKPWRWMSRRALVFVAATLAVLLLYRMWHQSVVFAVDEIVERERSGLAQVFRDASTTQLLGVPLPLLRSYMIAFEPMFHGWNPLVLLASPFALFALRRHPLTLFLAAGIVCYLLIIRFPILAIPYAYLTYFEILYTPIRNVIFFIHVLAGICVYLVAARVSRYDTRRALALAFAIGLAGALVVRYLGPFLAARPQRADLLFVPVLAGYAGVAWLAWARRASPLYDAWVDAPPPRWWLAMVTLCVPLILATELPSSSLRHVSWEASPATPAALMSSLPCLSDKQFCAPPERLIRFAEDKIPVNSVFAVDIADEYQPSLFMPQQMVAWPGTAEGLLPRLLFARYFERYDRAKAAYDDQPFFNTRESRSERLSFIRDLSVTHVLLNPRMHARMNRFLVEDPEVFMLLYDDGRWALYEVASRYRGLHL